MNSIVRVLPKIGVKRQCTFVSQFKKRYGIVLIVRIVVNYPFVSEFKDALLIRRKLCFRLAYALQHEDAKCVVVRDDSLPMALFRIDSEDLAPIDNSVIDKNIVQMPKRQEVAEWFV